MPTKCIPHFIGIFENRFRDPTGGRIWLIWGHVPFWITFLAAQSQALAKPKLAQACKLYDWLNGLTNLTQRCKLAAHPPKNWWKKERLTLSHAHKTWNHTDGATCHSFQKSCLLSLATLSHSSLMKRYNGICPMTERFHEGNFRNA